MVTTNHIWLLRIEMWLICIDMCFKCKKTFDLKNLNEKKKVKYLNNFNA